jgi:Ice-binding-like
MTERMMLTSCVSKGGAVLLLLPFGAACGSSGGEASTDGGDRADHAGSADGRNEKDVRGSSDAGSGGDDEGNGDDGDASDADALSAGAVRLGMAGRFVILAKSKISTVPKSAVTGDVGLSPAAASYITGFSLSESSTNVYSTSLQVTGKVFASNYAVPTPANLTDAIGDMQLAFTDAAGRAPDFTELGAGNIGGKTLVAGVYKWGTGLLVPTDITLTGGSNDVWIFQIAKDLTISSAVNVVLTGGAVPKNVFWQVAGLVTLGTTAHFEGVILSQTSIALQTGASINGRLLAQTAVTIDDSAVVEPAP